MMLQSRGSATVGERGGGFVPVVCVWRAVPGKELTSADGAVAHVARLAEEHQGPLRRPDWRYRGPTLEPGLGLGLAGERLVAGVFAHGTRPGSARNGDVGPPSSRLTTRSRKVHEGPVQCGLGSSRVGPRRPNPWTKTLAIGTWNVTSLGGKEPELVREVERYRLEIVGLTSTHSLGSGTQLLERGWTLHYSGVAQGEQAASCARKAPGHPRSEVDDRLCLSFHLISGRMSWTLRVKRGAELSTDHHLVVSWIRWQRRKLDRPGRPKRIVRVCWERLWPSPLSGRSSTPTSGRASHRFRGRLETLSPKSGPCSLPPLSTQGCSKLWTQGLWCLSWRQPPNPVVDTGIDRYRQAKQAAARTVLEAKTRVWEEFGGELLTSTGDIVGRWKKYFEDLLNPTDLPSNEEAEAGVSEVDSSITQAEVTEVVRKLRSGKAPGVDEIRPEYLKSLDVVGLSWLTRLCNIAWRLGTVPLVWQTGVVVPLFKKGDRRVCSNYRGITLLSLPGKVYARVLERRIRPIVDPRIQEEQCGFRPGRGTLDQLYTLHRVLEGLWEFAQPVHMCFVDLEKAFDRVPRGILWGVLRESMGSREPFAKGCSVSVRPEQELGSHCRQ
ncbi:hypothetical protein L3Q82_008565 [Scortum barcoo]|uniref:Uncharacterized protein n=1 Tax=Scortum barcoo TaxID=214431 RepID=A0ACB8XBR7_9TELE|nr:hypothetical protein L3Q82_008565 [Scortum barcoo]